MWGLFDDEAAHAADDGFETFWRAYPKKAGKQAALVVWRRLKPTRLLQEAILAALEAQKRTQTWRKAMAEPEMPYVPHARTWLHQRRWTDEVALPKAQPLGKKRWDCPHDPRCSNWQPCVLIQSRTCPHAPICVDRTTCVDKIAFEMFGVKPDW